MANDRRILKVSRLSVALMAVLGLLIALWVEDIIAIYQVALAFTASALVAPVLAAMFWERATKTGVIASMVGALTASLLWRLAGQPFGIHEIAPGLAASAVLLVSASLITSHSREEQVVAYFHAFRRGRLRDDDVLVEDPVAP